MLQVTGAYDKAIEEYRETIRQIVGDEFDLPPVERGMVFI